MTAALNHKALKTAAALAEVDAAFGGHVHPKPAHGTPEFNAIYDAGRKVLGYPSRQDLAEFDRRFPVYGTPEWHAAQAVGVV